MKNLLPVACAALVLVGVPTSAQQNADQLAPEASGKITDKKHPDYVLCRSEAVIGSLVKKRRVCLTNREWDRIAREGNSLARRLRDDMASGMTTN